MVTVGLLVRLQARPGKEAAVVGFLEGVMPLIRDEPATTALFGVRFGPSEFGIFNAFPDEAARQAHINGHAAASLFGRADELLASPPTIEPLEIVVAKLPPGAAPR
jgi:quinol monooxygenase YgiN